jgi:hypothetical protein
MVRIHSPRPASSLSDLRLRTARGRFSLVCPECALVGLSSPACRRLLTRHLDSMQMGITASVPHRETIPASRSALLRVGVAETSGQ